MPIRLEGITLYTVKDIEELLGVGNSTVRRYISQGRLKGRKMARRWYIPAENLLDYFRQSDQEPPTQLLDKLKELEDRLDKKERQPPEKISLARIGSRRRTRRSATPPAPPPVEPAPPLRSKPVATLPPEPIIKPDEALTNVERLLAQARRLKEEAARLERLYVTESDSDE